MSLKFKWLLKGLPETVSTCFPSQGVNPGSSTWKTATVITICHTVFTSIQNSSQCVSCIRVECNWLRWEWLKQPFHLTPHDVAQPRSRFVKAQPIRSENTVPVLVAYRLIKRWQSKHCPLRGFFPKGSSLQVIIWMAHVSGPIAAGMADVQHINRIIYHRKLQSLVYLA